MKVDVLRRLAPGHAPTVRTWPAQFRDDVGVEQVQASIRYVGFATAGDQPGRNQGFDAGFGCQQQFLEGRPSRGLAPTLVGARRWW